MKQAMQTKTSQRILERALSQRLALNPSYSKRALARQLGLSSSFLCHLMNGRRRLTPSVAVYLAQRLSLSPSEKAALLAETTGFAGEFSVRTEPLEVPKDKFSEICDWWYVAILEFLGTHHKSHEPEEIAKYFELSSSTVTLAIQKLERLGFIKKDPKRPRRFVRCHDSQLISSETPNSAIRTYHEQLLHKAKESIYIHTPDEKAVGSLVLAMDPEDLPEVKRRWREFRMSLEAFLSNGKKKAGVYVGFFEMFPVTKNPRGGS